MKAITVWQPVEGLWRPYLAGVLHGDGWCSPLTLGLRVKDRDFAETFCQGLQVICGLPAKPRRDERGYWLVRLGNKSGRFNDLRSYEPRDNDELALWLRGLFDSEGNAQLWLNAKVGPNSYSRRIAIYSTDKDTLERAATFMEWLEIAHSIRPVKPSAGHKGRKPVYELRVCRREGFTRFAEFVGSSIARKQSTISAIVATYQPPGWQARNLETARLARWPR